MGQIWAITASFSDFLKKKKKWNGNLNHSNNVCFILFPSDEFNFFGLSAENLDLIKNEKLHIPLKLNSEKQS